MDQEVYTVEEYDTIFSISLKFDMPVYNLLRMNQLSENSLIYAGMVLKVKKGVKKVHDIEEIAKMHLNKVTVFYCSKEGDVKGTLSFNEFVVIFTPDCVRQVYCLVRDSFGLQEKESLEFHVCVDFKDILSVSIVEYPGFDTDQLQQEQLYFKVMVSNTGSETVKSTTPKGTLYFRVIFM